MDLIDLDDIEEFEDVVYVVVFNLFNNGDLDIGEVIFLFKRFIEGVDNNEFVLLLI